MLGPYCQIFSVKLKKQTDGMIQFSTAHEHNPFLVPLNNFSFF